MLLYRHGTNLTQQALQLYEALSNVVYDELASEVILNHFSFGLPDQCSLFCHAHVLMSVFCCGAENCLYNKLISSPVCFVRHPWRCSY